MRDHLQSIAMPDQHFKTRSLLKNIVFLKLKDDDCGCFF